jgi:allantoin racemase
MKILEVMPWKATPEVLAYEQTTAPEGVDLVGLEGGLAVQCNSDITYNIPHLLDTIKDAEKKGYDAVVLACFGDPGVEIARELVDIPVLGPLKTALNVAAMLGHNICVLIPELRNLGYVVRETIVGYGMQGKVIVRGNNAPMPEVIGAFFEHKATGKISPFIQSMVDVCVKSAEEDGTDIVVLGCGSVKWMKDVLEAELRERGYPIMVINPLATAVHVARALVEAKLSQSRAAYPKPMRSARDAAGAAAVSKA